MKKSIKKTILLQTFTIISTIGFFVTIALISIEHKTFIHTFDYQIKSQAEAARDIITNNNNSIKITTETERLLPDGFLDTQDDQRSFSLYLPAQKTQIVAKQKLNITNRLTHNITEESIIIITLAFLLIIILNWISINHNLRPLSALSSIIKKRHPQQLQKIATISSNEEIKPITEAINHLFSRIKHHIRIEQNFRQNVAHEIKTPLATISTIIQNHILTNTTPNLEKLNTILKILNRSSNTVDQLLLLNKISSAPIQLKNFDLKNLLQETLAELINHNSHITLSLDYNLTSNHIYANEALTYTVIRNLIENSIKYCQNPVVINVKADEDKEKIYLTFTDNGPGIEKKHLEKINERFYRAHENSGTGLGLNIAEQIALAHGGNLEIDSSDSHIGLKVKYSIAKKLKISNN